MRDARARVRKWRAFRGSAAALAASACLVTTPLGADPKHAVPGLAVPHPGKSAQNLGKGGGMNAANAIVPGVAVGLVLQAGPSVAAPMAVVPASSPNATQVGAPPVSGAAGQMASAPGVSSGSTSSSLAVPEYRAASGTGTSDNKLGAGRQDAAVSRHGIEAGTGAANRIEAGGNSGQVLTLGERGEARLAAGKTIQVVDAGSPNLGVEFTAPSDQELDISGIIHDSRRGGVFAGLVRLKGHPREVKVTKTGDGRVLVESDPKASTKETGLVRATSAGGVANAYGKSTAKAEGGGKSEGASASLESGPPGESVLVSGDPLSSPHPGADAVAAITLAMRAGEDNEAAGSGDQTGARVCN